ncbi:MAG: hypothetical protein AAGF20_00820 [Pseudomonadota bacterium]
MDHSHEKRAVPSADVFAIALIASERPKDDDITALMGGDLPALAPRVWEIWRLLAGTALLAAGWHSDVVHRVLELNDCRCASCISDIPNKANRERAAHALYALREAGYVL